MKIKLVGLLIATLALGIVVGGVVIPVFLHPLAYLSYHITGSPVVTPPPQFLIIPAHINLGNLAPGEGGTAFGNATITIKNSGYYRILLFNADQLKGVFNIFNVMIQIGSQKVTLTLENNSAIVNLPLAGTYNVQVEVFYHVSEYPHGALTTNNMPFLMMSEINMTHPHPIPLNSSE